MERLSYLFICLLLFLSCEKGTGEFILKGTVLDSTFNQGLQNATLSLYKVPIGTSDELFVGSINLPANGAYEFKVPREKMERYILRAEKALYFPIEKEVYYSELSIKNPNEVNLSTKAMSWAKIHFKNNNPSAIDHFRYIKQEGLAACLCPFPFISPPISTK